MAVMRWEFGGRPALNQVWGDGDTDSPGADLPPYLCSKQVKLGYYTRDPAGCSPVSATHPT